MNDYYDHRNNSLTIWLIILLTTLVGTIDWSVVTLTNRTLDVMDSAIGICDKTERSIKEVTNFVIESKSIIGDVEKKVK